MDHEQNTSELTPAQAADKSLLRQAGEVGAAPYRVLARKYRPTTFIDLIGQQSLVRTLENAFELGRIHQAYLLTGVRGVGKTTTARILARAFNYEVLATEDQLAIDRPTIHMPTLGVHCQAIIDSRHVDVLEMDAASHTGIDDVREIIENARYRPVMARTKVYIIDEVHMLSKAAFNGLLKTLEEPPEHVKFIFATTEIDKVPVTVRSRCQRFDLRRIDSGLMTEHLHRICRAEEVSIDAEALMMIARAAEGSVRDALSLVDQAIAYGSIQESGALIKSDDLRLMLGVADKVRVIDLFEAVMAGEIAQAISLMQEQYNGGVDPAQLLVEMAEFVHLATRFKLSPEVTDSDSLTPEERHRGRAASERLTIPVLTRAWQILMKGLEELRSSPRPLQSADMVLVRLAYAAKMPTPSDALRLLEVGRDFNGSREALTENVDHKTHTIAAAPAVTSVRAGRGSNLTGNTSIRSLVATSPTAQVSKKLLSIDSKAVESVSVIESFQELIALAETKRDIRLKIALENDVKLVHFEHGRVEFELAPGGARDLASNLIQKIQAWTNERWLISVVATGGRSTLKEQQMLKEREKRTDLESDPLVAAVMTEFPGAQIISVRGGEDANSLAEMSEILYDDFSAEDND